MIKRVTPLLFMLILFHSCAAQQKVLNGFKISDPTVPADEILVGNPQRDGIPAIDDPQFVPAEEAGFLSAEEKVIGLRARRRITSRFDTALFPPYCVARRSGSYGYLPSSRLAWRKNSSPEMGNLFFSGPLVSTASKRLIPSKFSTGTKS